MARRTPGIYKHTDSKGNVSYRAHVHRHGRQIGKTFKHKADAIKWKAAQDNQIAMTGVDLGIEEARKIIVGDVVHAT
ncbi:MAG: hypothetical protein GEU95_10860 [Rhizobiales bacterium]|nr:hypothetical protein [Hyphomicrobiales bacterium]